MKIRIAIVGLGYWGPNYVRNFTYHPGVDVVTVCDISPIALQKIKQQYPHIQTVKDYSQLLNFEIDAVAIATPPATHLPLAKKFLQKKKHVFIAKPLAISAKEAKELAKIAQQNSVLLFTDLTYLYTDAVIYIKKLLQNKRIGNPLFYDSTRANLGIIQKDVNVIWDLAPHDLSILDSCFGFTPKSVFATATKLSSKSTTEEMAHITLTYTNNFIAHIHVSWISPVKLRTILIGSTKKMIYFNDIEQDEKIKIYNKGLDDTKSFITPFQPLFRSGDITIPRLGHNEALKREIDYFVQLLKKKNIDRENLKMNLRIIKILEGCDESIKKGKPVNLT